MRIVVSLEAVMMNFPERGRTRGVVTGTGVNDLTKCHSLRRHLQRPLLSQISMLPSWAKGPQRSGFCSRLWVLPASAGDLLWLWDTRGAQSQRPFVTLELSVTLGSANAFRR